MLISAGEICDANDESQMSALNFNLWTTKKKSHDRDTKNSGCFCSWSSW